MIPRDHSEEMTASVAASHGRHERQHARLCRAAAINICGFTSRTFHKTFRTIFVNEHTYAEHQHEQFQTLKFHAINGVFEECEIPENRNVRKDNLLSTGFLNSARLLNIYT
jgi:hypothetical protein